MFLSFLFQIAPSAKKLWGVEEQKDDTKGILNLNDHQMWRDSTWSTSGEYDTVRMAVFRYFAPFSLKDVYRRFIDLVMEAAGSSETLVKFCHTTRRSVPVSFVACCRVSIHRNA
jgi:hypothetical protein